MVDLRISLNKLRKRPIFGSNEFGKPKKIILMNLNKLFPKFDNYF